MLELLPKQRLAETEHTSLAQYFYAKATAQMKQVFPTNGAHRSLTTSWKVTGFLNKLKPAGGGLKEPVKKRRSLFNVFWKGGTPLPFLARSKRLSVSTCFCSLVQSPLK